MPDHACGTRARRAAALEDLDDDHAAAAARAWMRESLRLGAVTGICIVGLVLRNGYVEQFSRPRYRRLALSHCGPLLRA
jgi:hypothetical protein